MHKACAWCAAWCLQHLFCVPNSVARLPHLRIVPGCTDSFLVGISYLARKGCFLFSPRKLQPFLPCLILAEQVAVQVMWLPTHLLAAIFKEGVRLDACLEHLPPHQHPAALAAAVPEVTAGRVLRVPPPRAGWGPRIFWGGEPNTAASAAALCALLNAVANFQHLSELHLEPRIQQQERIQQTEPSADVATCAMSCPLLTDLEMALSSALSNLSCLRTLSLGRGFTKGSMLSVVASRLPSLQCLEELSVMGISVHSTCKPYQELEESIGLCAGLKTLSISTDSSGSKQSRSVHDSAQLVMQHEQLASSLVKLSSLEALKLCGRIFTGTFLGILVRKFRDAWPEASTMPSLRSLNLTDCQVGDHGADALWSWFKRLPSLQHLTLCDTQIFDRGAAVLANRLALLTGLRTLDMSLNFQLGRGAGASGGLKTLMLAASEIKTLVCRCCTPLHACSSIRGDPQGPSQPPMH